MNLHGIAGPIIAAVNPQIPALVQISIGQSRPDASGVRQPLFATPNAFIGAIAGNVLTVSAITAGEIALGQTITGAGVAVGTAISALGSGTGGVGTYSVNIAQNVASEAMAGTLTLLAQVQPLTWRDIQQVEGLNLQGTRRKIYLYGAVDGLVRSRKKGGDLISIGAGVNAGTWLVVQVLEQFPDWVSAACTLQDGS